MLHQKEGTAEKTYMEVRYGGQPEKASLGRWNFSWALKWEETSHAKNEGRAFYAKETPNAKTLKIQKKLVQGAKDQHGGRWMSTDKSIIKYDQG